MKENFINLNFHSGEMVTIKIYFIYRLDELVLIKQIVAISSL